MEVLPVLRHERDLPSEAVDDDAGQAVPAPKDHIRVGTAKHAERLFRKSCQVKIFKAVPADPLLIRKADLQHLVHPVVLDDPGRLVESDQVVILVVPGQGPGTDLVFRAALFLHKLFGGGPLPVLEADLPVPVHSLVQRIHVVVDLLVAGLHAVPYEDGAIELPGLLLVGQLHELGDQLP